MAGFFQRLFKIGSAEAHSIVDKLEDPVKMTEQGIRDLKKDQDAAMKNFAEVKAISIRAQRDMEKARGETGDWERKAMALLQQGQSGGMPMAKAEQLAGEALKRKEESGKRFLIAKQSYESQGKSVQTLQKNMDTLKSRIQTYENELVTLKARAKTANATTKLNKQLSSVDSNGTIAMLERMKEKVEEEETLALAYGDMADAGKSLEDEIDGALIDGQLSQGSDSDQLAALKAKMGIA